MSIEEWSSGFDYGTIHFEHLAWSGRYRFGFWIETTKSYVNSTGNHTFCEDFIFSTHHFCQFVGNPEAQRKIYSSPMDPVLYHLWLNPNFNNVCNTICKYPTKFHDSRVDHNYDIFFLLHPPIYCAMDLCGLQCQENLFQNLWKMGNLSSRKLYLWFLLQYQIELNIWYDLTLKFTVEIKDTISITKILFKLD